MGFLFNVGLDWISARDSGTLRRPQYSAISRAGQDTAPVAAFPTAKWHFRQHPDPSHRQNDISPILAGFMCRLAAGSDIIMYGICASGA